MHGVSNRAQGGNACGEDLGTAAVPGACRPEKEVDPGGPGGPRATNQRDAVWRDPSDREHGRGCRANDRRQSVNTEEGRGVRLRGAGPNGARDEVVDGTGVHGFVHGVDGPANEETGWCDCSHGGRGQRIALQMNAGRPTAERDIQAIVYHDARGGPVREVNRVLDDVGQDPGVEARFADLDDVDTGVNGEAQLPFETRTALSAARVSRIQPVERGHEVQDHSDASRSSNLCSRSSRGVKTGPSSARPASRFTKPSPLTAPRTKLFTRMSRRPGQAYAK